MRTFFMLIVFVLAGFSAEANAQSRYDIYAKYCPYREALVRNDIAHRKYTRQQAEEELNSYSKKEWDELIRSCRTDEAHMFAPPRASKDTLVEQPCGPPKKVVKRPKNAPMGEYYLCNRDTQEQDPNGNAICGPPVPGPSCTVAPRASDTQVPPRVFVPATPKVLDKSPAPVLPDQPPAPPKPKDRYA